MEEKTTKNPEKVSYEELSEKYRQLAEQANIMYQKLMESNMTNAFRRLDYLFKVLENKEAFDADFVKTSSDEIMKMIAIPDNPTETEE